MFERPSIYGMKVCFLAIFVSTGYAVSTDCPNLVIFAQGLGIQNKQPTIWTSLQGDCCTASGVVCLSQRVTQISWYNMGLNGILNGTALPSGLQYLYLYANQLAGGIPALPSGITRVNLNTNQLNGSIPALPSGLLTVLLGTNKLTGNLPFTWPSGLTIFVADTNQLTGSLPALFPIGLNELRLNGNQLIGNLPNFPSSLVYLSLGPGNQFTGTLKLNKPLYFYISDNRITDVVITDRSQLVGCNLSNNPLLGNPNIVNLSVCTMTGLYSSPNTMMSSYVKSTLHFLPNTMATLNAETTQITETIISIKWSTETKLFNQTTSGIQFDSNALVFVPTLLNWILMGLRILISICVLAVIIIKTPWARELKNTRKLRNKVSGSLDVEL